MARVLVVAAHPDDEVLGCGGAMARHAMEGDKVNVLFLADGVSSRLGDNFEAECTERENCARLASEILGAGPPEFLRLPDNAMDSLPLLKVVNLVEEVISRFVPSIIYTHHGGDLNIDHRIAHQAVITSCRPVPGSPVRAIYGFETLSSTEWASPASGTAFRPNRFVDITSTLELKTRALSAYKQEIQAFPHIRSHEALAALVRLRGATAGVGAAEAFAVEREIV
ncbi:PIG-L deacetylase family protein [Thalassospiraceae bacterium LMO-JJ14]|nr:PIG-L deacetylase family protein [Thalassospiraceae bacterium LMO-JJ14]